MLGMIATLGLSAKPENGFSDTILQDGTAKFISTAAYDVCISGLSVSAWVEFIPEPGHGRASKTVEEDTLNFDPIDLLPANSCNQSKSIMDTPRHGHSFILAMAIHHMNDSCSETSSEADDREECEIVDMESTSAEPIKVYQQPCGKGKGSGSSCSKASTHDTLPTMSGSCQDRSETIESFDYEDASEDNQYSTKDTLPSLSGFGDEENA